MIDFEKIKAEKEGKVTVGNLLNNILNDVETIEQIVYIALDKDGYVHVGNSHSESTLKTLGLIEAGKASFLDSLREG